MITIYIKKLEKEDKINKLNIFPQNVKKMIINFIKRTNNFFINEIDEKRKVYLLPNIDNINVYKKVISKIQKEKNNMEKIQVVLEDDIKQYKSEFKIVKVLDGKQIIKDKIDIILEKILEDEPIELQDIYILTNAYRELNVNIIRKMAPKVKSINIITKEIGKYSNLEEILQNEAIVNVANNKRKSLKKAKIIINLDFSKEEISEYNIFRNSIIINVTDQKLNNLKAFEGIIIQDIEMKLEEDQEKFIKDNNLNKNFKKIELYESMYNNSELVDNTEIMYLYGNNGIISEKELRNEQKILTNIKN